MNAFLVALGLIFVAELGDKTQLLTFALASKYSPSKVLLGVFIGTFSVNLVSVVAGQLVGMALPEFWIGLVAGLAFIGFGIWMFFGDEDEDEDEGEKRSPGKFGIVITVAVTLFLAEMGDKTMLAAMTIASHEQKLIPVWLGASLGMFAANAIAVLVGVMLGKALPERPIRIGAAVIFIASGLAILWRTIT